MKRRTMTLFLAVNLLLTMQACMHLGPDYQRPELGINVPNAYLQGNGQTVLPSPKDHWWREFNIPGLDELVSEALHSNLDIRKAAANVLRLRSRFLQTRSRRFPQLNLQGESQRHKQVFIFPFDPQGGTTEQQFITDSFDLGLAASFEIDLWGRLARADEAARAELLAAEESRRTVAQTVVAELVRLCLEELTIERRLLIAGQSIENFEKSLKFVMGRYEHGLVSSLDVRQSRRILAQAEATIPALMRELGTKRQQISVLLGRYPEVESPLEPQRFEYGEPPEVPVGLPSDLLQRRPDILAAEARLHAVSARIGEARANRFPQIVLTGQYGYVSTALSDLLSPQSEAWNLAAGLTQSVFDAGRLKAVEDEARAAYQQAEIDYIRTVLNAFREVESALLTRKEEIERHRRLLQFLQEARATQKVAERRYVRGLVDYLTVLEAQQTRYQAEDALVLVELSILTNQVALHRALGGGWGATTPTATSFHEDTRNKVEHQ